MNILCKNGLEYEASPSISVPHGFTARSGGVSSGIFSSLNLACRRGDLEENVAENYRLLSNVLGFDPQKTMLTRQTHSDIVRAVAYPEHLGFDHHLYPECDGLVTNTPGTVLVIFTADCTPILLHDPVTGAVGAAHAGWRGTAADIAGKTVRAMTAHFGCDPGNIRAAIGPNIGPCCFQTDADVPEAMLAAYGADAQESIRSQDGKFYVNLKELNALALRRAGLTQIDISSSCTVCQCHRFWSHRVTRGQRGSQGAVIVCKEG